VIAAIEGRELGLVALLFLPVLSLVDELVEIAFFEVVFFEEADVVCFRNEVGPVVISAPLVRGFGRVVDDAPLDVERVGGGHAHHLEEPVVDGLVETEGHGISVAVSFAEGEGAPRLGELFAVLIPGFEKTAIVEADSHRALAGSLVSSIGSAKAKADVIVNVTIVDQGGAPIVEETGFRALIDLVAAIVGRAVFWFAGRSRG
jgi:hypothetical protein